MRRKPAAALRRLQRVAGRSEAPCSTTTSRRTWSSTRGLALRELGDEKGACACFNSLLDYGERHLEDRPQVDYFAVSLPDFLVFEEDRTLADQVHCHYLMGLACFGYGRKEEASRAFRRALELDNSHLNCRIYLEMAEETAG